MVHDQSDRFVVAFDDERTRLLLQACRQAYGREYYALNRERRMAQDAVRKRNVRVERTKLLLAFLASIHRFRWIESVRSAK